MIQLGVGAAIGFALGSVFSKPATRPVLAVPNLTKKEWGSFCALMACSPTSFEAPSGRLGAFQFSVKRLADMGILPAHKTAFLNSPKIQYAFFLKSNRKYLPIANAYQNKEVDGKKASISGILGVLHVAGKSGFESWFSDPKIRKKFSNTTNTFNRTNGVF